MKNYNGSFADQLQKIIRFLTEPSTTTDIHQRRQERLLTSLLLIIILLGGISGITQLLIVPNFLPTFIVMAGAVTVMSMAYVLTRSRYYLAAAILTSIVPCVVSYLGLLTNPGDQPAFVFLLIGVLLASVLLSQWFVIGITAINLIGLLILPILQPLWTFSRVAGHMSYHIIFSALIVIAMQHRDLLEYDKQKELFANELQFHSIFDNSIDAIGVSKNGVHIVVNSAYLTLFRYDNAEQLVDTSVLDLVAPSERAKIQSYILRRFAGESVPLIYETRGIRRDGSEFDMEVHISTYLLDDELYTLSILRNITERKRTEEEREKLITELTAKNAELERFTYTVSHDLKSPLVTMKGFLGYLEQDAISGNLERLKGDTKRIANAVDKMGELLDDLLELSRIGRFINPPESIPFEELAHEALELVRGRLNERGVTMILQPDLPIIYGDRRRLTEVLQNLLDNAAKYLGDQPQPHIEIGRCGEENGKPLFYVKDNGIGIAPEYHQKIFGLFNKLEADSEGTGIGLALVKRIIEFHRGRIWVESKVGKGSAFCFTLPTQPEDLRFDELQINH
jgi:PAS domain S-box-containing protein